MNLTIFLLSLTLVYSVSAGTIRSLMKVNLLHGLSKRQSDDGHFGDQEMCFTIQHLQALKDQFASYIDKNRDERASRDEILAYLQKYNPDTTETQLDNFISRRDKDGDGSVDFIPDYLMEVSSPDYDLKTAREWFDLEDTNQDGFVTRDELISIAIKVGMTPEEAEHTAVGYYMSADANGDGKLSWDEYKNLFLPPQ